MPCADGPACCGCGGHAAQVDAVNRVLRELEVTNLPLLTVWNKVWIGLVGSARGCGPERRQQTPPVLATSRFYLTYRSDTLPPLAVIPDTDPRGLAFPQTRRGTGGDWCSSACMPAPRNQRINERHVHVSPTLCTPPSAGGHLRRPGGGAGGGRPSRCHGLRVGADRGRRALAAGGRGSQAAGRHGANRGRHPVLPGARGCA